MTKLYVQHRYSLCHARSALRSQGHLWRTHQRFVVAALVTSAANNGWTAPPASPTAAVVYGSEWVDTKSMMKWGLLTALIHVIVTMSFGYLLGTAICG